MLSTTMPEDFEIEFETFTAKRDALNNQLAISRQIVDRLMEERAEPLTIRWIAQLEVYLKIRRDQLEALVALDDDFVNFLLQANGRQCSTRSLA
jgi:hypothetical protein